MEENNVEFTAIGIAVPQTKAKVITARTAEELELKLNKFLSSNDVNLIDTNSATTPGGVYYTILYRNKIENV